MLHSVSPTPAYHQGMRPLMHQQSTRTTCRQDSRDSMALRIQARGNEGITRTETLSEKCLQRTRKTPAPGSLSRIYSARRHCPFPYHMPPAMNSFSYHQGDFSTQEAPTIRKSYVLNMIGCDWIATRPIVASGQVTELVSQSGSAAPLRPTI